MLHRGMCCIKKMNVLEMAWNIFTFKYNILCGDESQVVEEAH